MNDAAEATGRDQRVCAYIAMSYVLGIRTIEAIKGSNAPGPGARALLAGLAHPERRERAKTLASALGPVVEALDRRRVA